ncbi:arylesterase [Limnohabitans sp. T6-20]|uniref:arylesterase n=1 Tax=Limnohabitans sp. T6-20 TaxID=1100725 RepID=UPI000D38CEE1|nr:arylesterase [Limnohabitans sp. T6-20]PUE10514.1 arylesterase [Limnohabitans sp. T6-20]
MHKPLLRRRHFNWTLLALAGWGFVAPAQAATPQRILVVGDSLSAEYGLARGTGWVALLQKQLARDKPGVQVINASISGDTTSGGRSRLPALLQKHQPSHVIIELGGNDALRGLPLNMTQDNLQAMTRQAQAAGAQVILLGMQMPPNYGPDMAKQFEAAYAQVAKSQKAALVPFFLKGIGDDPDPLKWFQADRIHPNEAAQPRMLANIWPTLKKQLK